MFLSEGVYNLFKKCKNVLLAGKLSLLVYFVLITFDMFIVLSFCLSDVGFPAAHCKVNHQHQDLKPNPQVRIQSLAIQPEGQAENIYEVKKVNP